MTGLNELQLLRDGGLPVPEFKPIQPGQRLPCNVLGDIVIIKPGHAMASLGKDMHVRHTEAAPGSFMLTKRRLGRHSRKNRSRKKR
jgi:hypothetical protein